jgi:uncharacterized membrane protein
MRVPGFGRALFGTALAGLAMLVLVYGNFTPLLEPLRTSSRWIEVCVYASGAILLAASAGLLFARTASLSAIVIGAYGLAWVVARVRPILIKPMSIGSWYGVCEAMGPLLGAWIIYALLHRTIKAHAVTMMTCDRALRVARFLFGAACIEYGAAHFAFAAYTASMVPACLPGRMGIVYLTGACHIAAGLGLLVGILPSLAATLEAVMMGLFGVFVWLPSFFSHPVPDWASPKQVQLSETFLTFLMAASALIVAASLRSDPRGFAQKLQGDLATPVT